MDRLSSHKATKEVVQNITLSFPNHLDKTS